MFSDVIWALVLGILAVENMVMAIEEMHHASKPENKFHTGSFLINIAALIMCVAACCLRLCTVYDYVEHPKVLTTTPPQVDTLQDNNTTYYLYKFQDNHYRKNNHQ